MLFHKVAYTEEMKVSVVVPAFDAFKFLEECLLSVKAQTIKADEILVVNDGSTDNTEWLAHRLGAITIDRLENKGIGFTRKEGAEIASGDYIAYLSADDAYDPYFLELMLRQRRDDKTIMFSNYWKCNEKLKPQQAFISPHFQSPREFRRLVAEWALQQNMFVNFSTVIIPRQVFEQVQFDETLRYGEDLIFLLETVKAGFTWQNVTLPLVYYRIHEESGTKKGWNPQHRANLWKRLMPLLQDFGVTEELISKALRMSQNISVRKQRKSFIPLPVKIVYRKLRRILV